jgi:hypothetical protein
MVRRDIVPCDGIKVHGVWLENLAVRVKLYRTEWRVIAVVLSVRHPVTASYIAKRLRLDYALVKRAVRVLARWSILERTPAGIIFQPDHARWEPPRPRSGVYRDDEVFPAALTTGSRGTV